MKEHLIAGFLMTLLSCSIAAQVDIKATMGVNMVSMPGLRDYLNVNYARSNQLSVFSTAVYFSGEADYQFEKMQIGIDLSSETNSYNFDQGAGQYTLSYSFLQPNLMLYHFIQGEGYKFRFGAGVGPRFLSVSETDPYIITSETNYKTTGFGIIGRIDASTAVSKSVFAYLGGDIGFNYLGVPSSGNKKLQAPMQPDGVKFTGFFVGLRLGILYSITL